MSTRSAIGYQLPSGRIKAVYCHWDGHPDTKEPELKKYKNLELVRKLIKKGSMSSLETTEVWDGGGYLNNARESQPLYHSERGDQYSWDLIKPTTHSSKKKAMEFFAMMNCEWFYIYTPDGWKTFEIKGGN